MRYTDAARARLEVAFAAYELSELARTAVPIDPGHTGSTLADAAEVLAAAQRFFEAATAFERVRENGPPAEVNTARGEPSWWRAYVTLAPIEAARDLDDWVLRHQDGDADLGPTPVSGSLRCPIRLPPGGPVG